MALQNFKEFGEKLNKYIRIYLFPPTCELKNEVMAVDDYRLLFNILHFREEIYKNLQKSLVNVPDSLIYLFAEEAQ